jgi:hypothetical protein
MRRVAGGNGGRRWSSLGFLEGVRITGARLGEEAEYTFGALSFGAVERWGGVGHFCCCAGLLCSCYARRYCLGFAVLRCCGCYRSGGGDGGD